MIKSPTIINKTASLVLLIRLQFASAILKKNKNKIKNEIILHRLAADIACVGHVAHVSIIPWGIKREKKKQKGFYRDIGAQVVEVEEAPLFRVQEDVECLFWKKRPVDLLRVKEAL